MTTPRPRWLSWIVAPYAAFVAFTFYALTVLDEDYALWLLLICGAVGLILIARMAHSRVWLFPLVVVCGLAVAWSAARFYFS